MLDLMTLTPAHFEPLVGTRFAVAGQADVLELLEVVPLPSPSSRQQPFSLVFTSRTHRLAQASFPLAHAALGEFELFIVPIQPDARGPLYEAVFN